MRFLTRLSHLSNHSHRCLILVVFPTLTAYYDTFDISHNSPNYCVIIIFCLYILNFRVQRSNPGRMPWMRSATSGSAFSKMTEPNVLSVRHSVIFSLNQNIMVLIGNLHNRDAHYWCEMRLWQMCGADCAVSAFQLNLVLQDTGSSIQGELISWIQCGTQHTSQWCWPAYPSDIWDFLDDTSSSIRGELISWIQCGTLAQHTLQWCWSAYPSDIWDFLDDTDILQHTN